MIIWKKKFSANLVKKKNSSKKTRISKISLMKKMQYGVGEVTYVKNYQTIERRKR